MTEKKRPPVIALIYHAGFSALLTPGSNVNAGCGHSLAGVRMGSVLLPSLDSCFAATHYFFQRQARWKQRPINSEDGLCDGTGWK